MEEKLKFAVFIDFDNIEIGVKSTLGREFDVAVVLEALKERGEVVTKIAYGNWKMAGRHSEKMAAHAVQMVQRDPSPRGDKNGADINLALDALEMAFTRDFINAFAIVGGDSDFIALVERLKQYNKAVYVVGGRGFTSTILQKNCREFISYENLIQPLQAPTPPGRVEGPRRSRRGAAREDVLPLSSAMPLLTRALKVLADREHEPLLGLVKSTMMQLDSAFSERDYGVSSFLDFAQKLAGAGLVKLDRRNGNYMLRLTGGEQPVQTAEAGSPEESALAVLREVLQAAARRGRRDFHVHGLKQFVSKMRPGFDERKYGFKQFSALLNLAYDRGLVSIEPDEHGAMRVRFPERDAEPPAESETGPEEMAALLPAFDSQPQTADMADTALAEVGGEDLAVAGTEPAEGAPEPEAPAIVPEAAAAEEAPPAPKRRRAAAPGATTRWRAPRKKKTPQP